MRTPYSVAPYGKDTRGSLGPSHDFDAAGYIFVFQDVRGCWMSEGVFDFLMKTVAKEIVAPLPNDAGPAMKALQALIARYDYSTFGGAPLLGVDGICIICHGSSGDRAIKNALAVAARYARAHLNELIVQQLENAPSLPDVDAPA